MFRLNIDIPLFEDEKQSSEMTQKILDAINMQVIADTHRVPIQYRMSRDEDSKPRNYLIKDAQGHCATKKIKIEPQ